MAKNRARLNHEDARAGLTGSLCVAEDILMTEIRNDLYEAYEDIVRECLIGTTLDYAIIMVGIFYESKVHFTKYFKDLVYKAEQWKPNSLPPLTLEEAAAIVSRSTRHSIQQLIDGFRTKWLSLKHSEMHLGIIKKIETHKFIAFVEEVKVS